MKMNQIKWQSMFQFSQSWNSILIVWHEGFNVVAVLYFRIIHLENVLFIHEPELLRA